MKGLFLAFASLAFVGCAPKLSVKSNNEISAKTIAVHEITAKFASEKPYMQKYLPENIKISPNANISVLYDFSISKNDNEKLEFFKPIVVSALPKDKYHYRQVGNLRFFDDKGHKIEFSALCEVAGSKGSFFDLNDISLGDLRKDCAKKLSSNLKNQINESYEKGDFNVFK